MKFFVLIFSLYLLALPCLPCTDAVECAVTAEQNVLKDTSHQQHQHEDEACNPFCSCACCGHTFSPYQPVAKLVKKIPLKETTAYPLTHTSLPARITGQIWQPPKVC